MGTLFSQLTVPFHVSIWRKDYAKRPVLACPLSGLSLYNCPWVVHGMAARPSKKPKRERGA